MNTEQRMKNSNEIPIAIVAELHERLNQLGYILKRLSMQIFSECLFYIYVGGFDAEILR